MLIQLISPELLVGPGGKVHLLTQVEALVTLSKLVGLRELNVGKPSVEFCQKGCFRHGSVGVVVAVLRFLLQVSCSDVRSVDSILGWKLSRIQEHGVHVWPELSMVV